jgi:hypothetical protein
MCAKKIFITSIKPEEFKFKWIGSFHTWHVL